MSGDPTFKPRLRRIAVRPTEYEPARIGPDDAAVCVRLYANPFTESSRLFYDDVYDEFQIGALGDADVAFEVRPAAPEMRMWATATAFDARRAVGDRDGDAVIEAVDAAEFFHAVREAAGDEAFHEVVERACLVADNDLLTYDRLCRFADDLDADVDGRRLLRRVERGEYRGRVRHDSQMWIRRVGRATADEERPANITAFVAGEPLAEFSYAGLRSQVISRLELRRTEREAEENH